MIDDTELLKDEDEEEIDENPYTRAGNAGDESDENPYTENIDDDLQVIQEGSTNQTTFSRSIIEEDDEMTQEKLDKNIE